MKHYIEIQIETRNNPEDTEAYVWQVLSEYLDDGEVFQLTHVELYNTEEED
jgi:hypothetical protein